MCLVTAMFLVFLTMYGTFCNLTLKDTVHSRLMTHESNGVYWYTSFTTLMKQRTVENIAYNIMEKPIAHVEIIH